MATVAASNECLLKSNEDADWSRFPQNFEEQREEIEVLKSFYEATDNFDVVDEASIESKQLYTLQFRIKTDTQDNLIVELWLPIEKTELHCATDEIKNLHIDHDDEPTTTPKEKKMTQLKENNKNDNDKPPTLQRSISGKRAHTQIKCNYLPHLFLDITLPEQYPSERAPIYKFSCVWLSKSQLVDICNRLDDLWQQNVHSAILYIWIDWLQSNLLDHLDMVQMQAAVAGKITRIILTPLNDDEQQQKQLKEDSRAESLFIDSDDLIFQFLRHNFIEDSKAFRTTMQNCLICFDEKLGDEFYRLSKCKHHFCTECMSSMCQMHVKEGTIQLLKCPEKDCDEFVPVEIMQQVLDRDEFDRWERLLLQRTLDTMEDIIYCPKCANPITIEPSNTHSFCMYCKMDFCRQCKDNWHVGPCVDENQKLANKLKRHNLDAKQLMQMSDEEIKRHFGGSGAAAILNLRQKAIENKRVDELEKLLRKYISCPKCRIHIEKIEGCNKVTCRCGTILCYVCGHVISGYEHFNEKGCNLWTEERARGPPPRPQHEGQLAINRVINLVPEQHKNLINCPTCAQRCLKVERNNHIKCWLCTTNFCFCCRKRIVGIITNHFRNGTCKQHSD